jgi:hypothetical protein
LKLTENESCISSKFLCSFYLNICILKRKFAAGVLSKRSISICKSVCIFFSEEANPLLDEIESRNIADLQRDHSNKKKYPKPEKF